MLVQPLAREAVTGADDLGSPLAELEARFPAFDFSLVRAGPPVWWYAGDGADGDGANVAASRTRYATKRFVEPESALRPRVAALASWLRARPERRIALVGHHDLTERLTGLTLRNCELACVLAAPSSCAAAADGATDGATGAGEDCATGAGDDGAFGAGPFPAWSAQKLALSACFVAVELVTCGGGSGVAYEVMLADHATGGMYGGAGASPQAAADVAVRAFNAALGERGALSWDPAAARFREVSPPRN